MREVSGGRKFLEQRRGDHVDARVGTLRGEDGGHQQLPRIAVVQGALRAGIGLRQALQQRGNALRSQWIAPRLPGRGLFRFPAAAVRLLDWGLRARAFIGG